MTDDSEALDWGHEDELAVAVRGSDKRTFDMDDAEDAVSLGGDEEDEFLTYQSRAPQDTAHSPPKSARHPRQDHPTGRSDSQPQEPPAERTGSGDQSSLLARSHSFGTLVHALPPKPVVSTVPFVHPSHPSVIEATAMASRADRDKRNGAGSKAGVYDHNDSLPPGWEIKYPRNGRGVYYYNIHTQESTWTPPSTREKRAERSDGRDDPLDKPLSTRNGETLIPRVGRAEMGDMSYNDRHYRPGESARREERPVRPAQRLNSYVADSYSPNPSKTRPSSPSPRARDWDSTPPPRRPPSPNGSYGDRDGVQSSYHEAPSVAPPSAQDRVRVAHDNVPHEHPRQRTQRNDPTPSETERRNLPRDTERSSTTRPRSPASYTRGSQESANTTPRSSIKPSHPVLEAPPAGRRNRFLQADAPAQHSHRQSESRDVGMRRARTDDVSHSARYVDDIPSSRSISDMRGDDDTLIHPASDAQRSGSRKRTPLPPQGEVSHPGARPAPVQRGGGHPSGPAGPALAPVPRNRHISRIVPDDTLRDSARRSPSPPPPQFRHPPAERVDLDRGRSRWSKPHANGPSQMDSRTTHESSRGRVPDVAMDVDDAPLPRSSDPPTKQIPPRRPALQDDVPRYPRAMLNSDNDGPPRVGVRDVRDGMDSRYRSAVDGSSRFGPQRDRLGTERRSTDQMISQPQKEPNRAVETGPPPFASNIKLSGTNNIPIGARNKFAGNAPPLPVPPNSTRRAPAATSGSNGEPVAPRRDRVSKDHERPPHLYGTTDDRGAPMEPAGREDVQRSPPNNPRALPPAEPAALPTRPSRAALGISRFGPPIVKENIEPVRPQASISSESVPSELIPESSSRATPPPPSRESSMASFRDVTAPVGRPSHLPPRPASPPRGYQFRSGDANEPHHRFNARSPVAHESRGNEVNAEAPARPRPPSLTSRKRAMDTYASDPPPAPRDNRAAHSPERPRTNHRDSEVARPPPPAAQDEDCDRAQPPMHPERALMLQANGLPPRPPSALGPARSGRGFKRDRRDDRDHDRAEPLRGNSMGRYGSASPASERRRYPEDDRSVGYGGGGGASLLDRLTLDEGTRVNSPSLRDRVQLPSKRDREEMLSGEFSFDTEGNDHDGSKRVRRRGGIKVRKGRC